MSPNRESRIASVFERSRQGRRIAKVVDSDVPQQWLEQTAGLRFDAEWGRNDNEAHNG
jgi:hypothetical protein